MSLTRGVVAAVVIWLVVVLLMVESDAADSDAESREGSPRVLSPSKLSHDFSSPDEEAATNIPSSLLGTVFSSSHIEIVDADDNLLTPTSNTMAPAAGTYDPSQPHGPSSSSSETRMIPASSGIHPSPTPLLHVSQPILLRPQSSVLHTTFASRPTTAQQPHDPRYASTSTQAPQLLSGPSDPEIFHLVVLTADGSLVNMESGGRTRWTYHLKEPLVTVSAEHGVQHRKLLPSPDGYLHFLEGPRIVVRSTSLAIYNMALCFHTVQLVHDTSFSTPSIWQQLKLLLFSRPLQ